MLRGERVSLARRSESHSVASRRRHIVGGYFADMVIVVVLLTVFMTMLVEALVSRAHERTLRAAGAIEPADDVYPLMRVVYPACFALMGTDALLRDTQGARLVPGIVMFVLAKTLKWWAIASLADRWSFRVLVLPGMALVNTGPYRFLRHPNYLAIVGELAGVSLMLGAFWTGTLACLAFGPLIWMRIRIEEAALGLGGDRKDGRDGKDGKDREDR